MARQVLKFNEWTPDQPGVTGALMDAKNVVPKLNGYGPLPTPVDLSNAADESLLKIIPAKFSSTIKLFAGGATKLFLYDASDQDLDNVSKSGNYNTGTNWYFTQFGNRVIAANGVNILQSYVLGTSSLFADLNASAPVAKYVSTVKDFVVAGNVSNNENRVYWSDINDATNWTSGTTSQADNQALPDGGQVQGITGGEFGLILLEKAIVRMSYIGAPLFFQFDTISRNVGCLEPRSVVQFGALTYFLSENGFYSCNGQSLTPIGTEKVNRFFDEDANASLFEEMSAAVDPLNNLVIWSYKNNAGTKSLLIYNFQIQKWSRGITTADFIAAAITSGITLEGLDSISTSIDALTSSLDSKLWSGGEFLLAGTSTTKIVTFTGTPETAEIVTEDISVSGQNSMITLAKPIVERGSASAALASRNRLDEDITFGTETAASADNRAGVRGAGKYHRLKILPTGGEWKTAVGVEIDIFSAGMR